LTDLAAVILAGLVLYQGGRRANGGPETTVTMEQCRRGRATPSARAEPSEIEMETGTADY
jgi:hypothetical protein